MASAPKIEIVENDDVISEWSDQRDIRLMTSIKADLPEASAVKPTATGFVGRVGCRNLHLRKI
jgi:hypothetical protein